MRKRIEKRERENFVPMFVLDYGLIWTKRKRRNYPTITTTTKKKKRSELNN